MSGVIGVTKLLCEDAAHELYQPIQVQISVQGFSSLWQQHSLTNGFQ
jgi:hypothetical protein